MFKAGYTLLLLSLLMATTAIAQPEPAPYGPVPTARQLAWQETEVYGIIHFSMPTYTDREWGVGNEDRYLFDPPAFNAMQILSVAKAGGLKGIVVVAKHHDGFCLWPTKTTFHNISHCFYKDGNGDMLREYRQACDKLQMKLGIYCSPWDRNNPLYGKPEYVTQVYKPQLAELYSNYGPLFMSWHDGANGGDGYYGGANDNRKIDRSTYYGWDSLWATTRRMQPTACIFGDAGPDVRWVGNEEGIAGNTCWATYTPHTADGSTPANGNVQYQDGTEGTRNGKYWMPAECDVPLRRGWFYHKADDGFTKTPEQLTDLYFKSVGRGACLDLGLAPTKEGLLSYEDAAALKRFGETIKQTFAANFAKRATITASNIRGGSKQYSTKQLIDSDRYSYWATDDSVTDATLTLDLPKATTFNVIRLRENIKLGQRIDSVTVDNWSDGKWQRISAVTSVGACRLIRFSDRKVTTRLRFHFYAPVCLAVSDVGLFLEPTPVYPPSISQRADGAVIIPTVDSCDAYYTINGHVFKPYKAPFKVAPGSTIRAININRERRRSSAVTFVAERSKAKWVAYTGNTVEDNPQPSKYLVDGDVLTIGNIPPLDGRSDYASIIVDMNEQASVSAFTYTPFNNRNYAGRHIDKYELCTSLDGEHWHKVAEGEFANIAANPVQQVIRFKQHKARYFKFTPVHVADKYCMTIAELGAF
jgi:alpha-L-fucosidase